MRPSLPIMQVKGGKLTMASHKPAAPRYPAPSPRRAIKEIAESWKAAGMVILEPAVGQLCAVPGCDKPSVVRIDTVDGDRLLCMAHEVVARDLAEGRNPYA